MRIGILGSGRMGGKLGTLFVRAGHDVVFSYSHIRRKLDTLASDAGARARAGTPAEAAEADVLLLAVHWNRVDDVLKQAGDLTGKVLVSCCMPMNDDDSALVVGHTSSGAETLASKVPGARVVSAFGTVPSEVLFAVYETRRRKRRPSLLYCGDDARAKKTAAKLIRDVGFEPMDLGPWRWRATRSRSRCSSRSWRTRGTRGRRSRIGSRSTRSASNPVHRHAAIGCSR
jgi:predicted dinucleotide-binding enzyme